MSTKTNAQIGKVRFIVCPKGSATRKWIETHGMIQILDSDSQLLLIEFSRKIRGTVLSHCKNSLRTRKEFIAEVDTVLRYYVRAKGKEGVRELENDLRVKILDRNRMELIIEFSLTQDSNSILKSCKYSERTQNTELVKANSCVVNHNHIRSYARR